MSLFRRIRIYLFGPDQEMLDAPPAPPIAIMTEWERERMKAALKAHAELG